MKIRIVLVLALLSAVGLSATGALAQTNKGAKPFVRYDLNGEWQAEFHDPGQIDIEKIMIVDYGDGLVATKETGDKYVPAGKVTFRGNYTSNPFPAQAQGAQAGYVNPGFFPTTVTVIDQDHFTTVDTANGALDHWMRLGKVALALDDAILFDINKSELRPDGAAALDKVVRYLNQMHPKSNLVVAGYTDDTGSDALNLPLSERRARSVAAVLKAKGIAAGRLVTKGYGKANPRYPNVNDDARAHNRRVEIVVQE